MRADEMDELALRIRAGMNRATVGSIAHFVAAKAIIDLQDARSIIDEAQRCARRGRSRKAESMRLAATQRIRRAREALRQLTAATAPTGA